MKNNRKQPRELPRGRARRLDAWMRNLLRPGRRPAMMTNARPDSATFRNLKPEDITLESVLAASDRFASVEFGAKDPTDTLEWFEWGPKYLRVSEPGTGYHYRGEGLARPVGPYDRYVDGIKPPSH